MLARKNRFAILQNVDDAFVLPRRNVYEVTGNGELREAVRSHEFVNVCRHKLRRCYCSSD